MPFIMYHLTHYIPMLLLLLATYCFLPVISLYPQNTHHRLMTMPPTFYAVSLWNTNTSYHLHLICYYLYCTCYHLHAISLWKTNPPAMYPFTSYHPIVTCYRLHPITLWNTNIPTTYRLHAIAYMLSLYGRPIYLLPIAYMLLPTCYHSMDTHAPTAYMLPPICYHSKVY